MFIRDSFDDRYQNHRHAEEHRQRQRRELIAELESRIDFWRTSFFAVLALFVVFICVLTAVGWS